MRLPRMTTRRWMIAVAVVAAGCAAVASLTERRERFARIAARHAAVFMTPTSPFPDPDRGSAKRVDWHLKMRDEYWRAARYPWLPVEPDPPLPE